MIDPNEKLEEAVKLIQENDFQGAMTIFGSILDSNPEEPIIYECLSNIGFLYYNSQQYQDAKRFLNEALILPFTDYHGILNKLLGFIYISEGKSDIASEYLIEALIYLDEENLETAIIRFELGKLLLELNDLKLSYQYLKDAELFFKDNNREYINSVIYYLGMNSFMSEEIELAESYFNVLLLSKDIKNSDLVHGYFGALHIANYLKNAENIFKYASKILELDPNFYDRETLTYMTVKAYEYQNREREYYAALELFIKDYPQGKYNEQYEELKMKEFNSIK